MHVYEHLCFQVTVKPNINYYSVKLVSIVAPKT